MGEVLHDQADANVMRFYLDEEQLAYATLDRRAIVTKNRDDFLEIADRFIAEGIEFTSVLIISTSLPTNDFFAVAKALAHWHGAYPEDFVPYLLSFVHPAPDD